MSVSIILILLLVPIAAIGDTEWSTNLWPSFRFQFKARQRAIQVFSGIVERTSLISGFVNPSPPFFFTQRKRLIDYKDTLKEIIPEFLNISLTNGNGTFDSTFGTQQVPLNTGLPHWAVTNIVEFLQIPINYFDYTPFFYLNGLGSFGDASNDFEGVGHVFGYTNDATGAGGTNFPSTRVSFPTWKTTDYGWIYMTNVINVLVWTEEIATPVTDEQLTNGFHKADFSPKTSNDWTGLRQDFIDFYATNFVTPFEFVGPAWRVILDNIGSPTQGVPPFSLRYLGGVFAAGTFPDSRGHSFISNTIPTNFAHSADIYARSAKTFTGASPDTYFDFTTIFPTNDIYRFMDRLPEAFTNTRVQATILTNASEQLPISSNDVPSPIIKIGQLLGDFRYVLKWDGTNGFKYVKP